MSDTARAQTTPGQLVDRPNPPTSVNHIAYQTLDLAATHTFYTETLGCRYAGALHSHGSTSTTGETVPAFLHVFYEMPSGECLAFFDIEGDWNPQPDGLPVFTRHLALAVESRDAINKWIEWLTSRNIVVSHVVHHEDIWESIYFFDPNGLRLELTYQLRSLNDADATEADRLLAEWSSRAVPS